MSLAVQANDKIVKKRPGVHVPNNFLGVIKSIPDMRILMRKERIELPVEIAQSQQLHTGQMATVGGCVLEELHPDFAIRD